MIKYRLAATGLALLATLAHADGDYFSPTDDRVRVSLGIMRVSSSTTLQVDSSTGVPGTVIDGESMFGLDRSDIEPKFQVMVRAGERNRIRLDYFTLDRDDTSILTEPIVFRNALLQAGDPAQIDSTMRLLTLSYGYSFWHGEKLELAATLGVSSVQIGAQAKVQTAATHINQTEDVAGPFPTPGIDATWAATKRFYLDGRAQYLNVHVSDLSGSLGLYELDALFRFRPNISFALGYTEVREYISSTKTSSAGLFDFNSKGPELFVRVAF
ncbi:MAG TPA: hypothetical protein VK437_13900 [Steroidobacteraceae bacterium]|nr:hypothetical protein [Steroidobacteraceae bacterium]